MFTKESILYLIPLPHKPFCAQLKEKKSLIPTIKVLLSSEDCLTKECSCLSSGNRQTKWDRKNEEQLQKSPSMLLPLAQSLILPSAVIAVFSQGYLSQKQTDHISA